MLYQPTVCLAVLLVFAGCGSDASDPARSTRIENSAESTVTQPQHDQLRPDTTSDAQDDSLALAESSRTKESDPLTRAPEELLTILRQYKSTVDFRHVTDAEDPYSGLYWRMDLNNDVLQSHIEKFKLKPSSSGPLTEKFHRNFPDDWPDISAANLQWYAWPYNRDDGRRLQLWFVMAVDADASTLYFFHQNLDFTA